MDAVTPYELTTAIEGHNEAREDEFWDNMEAARFIAHASVSIWAKKSKTIQEMFPFPRDKNKHKQTSALSMEEIDVLKERLKKWGKGTAPLTSIK